MSSVMVMHNEMEQLHRNVKEETAMPLISDHIFNFDKTSLVEETHPSCGDSDISYHSSMEAIEINSVSSNKQSCKDDQNFTLNEDLDNNIDVKSDPSIEPLLEKIMEPNITDMEITQPFEGSTTSENSLTGGSEVAENMQESHQTSDDDLLEELDKVVTTSTNEDDLIVEADGPKESVMNIKKMEALKRRLNYTIQERKHLEIENINLERKIDALVRNHALESKEILNAMEIQKDEVEELKKKLLQQMEASKLEVQKLKDEHQREVKFLNKKIEDFRKEKDEAVMRYAVAEQKNIDMADRLQKSEAKLKEWSKERETALSRWKTMKSENKRAFDICEAQKNEINQLKKDNDRLKESESSNENKLKWQQNKLKAEQDSHKETSCKLSELNKTMQDMQIHSFAIFDSVRSVYLVLQDLYTCQSNQPTPPPLPPPPKPDTNITQLLPIIMKDLQMLIWKQREVVAEMRTYKDKIHCLELERLSQRDELTSLKESLKTQQHDNEVLREATSRLRDIEKDYIRLISEADDSLNRTKDLEASNKDLSMELSSCRSREMENMEFNSRLMIVNSELKALNDTLSQELKNKSAALESLQKDLHSMQSQLSQIILEKQTECAEFNAAAEVLKKQLEESRETVECLKTKKQELEDEIKTMKKRYTAIVKDLRRHVASSKRPPTSDDLKCQPDTGSLYSSHGGSSLSLDTHGGGLVNAQSSPPSSSSLSQQPPHNRVDSLTNQCEPSANGDINDEYDDPNIVMLLKHLERKSRKINFLKEHVDHLTEELHRKSQIIRDYALREQSGSLVPEASDRNKAQLSKKGGIMASLYTLNAKDSGMTLSLSMEINQKLQALVEDALLKNIKYKESMDLLGQEIDWLTEDNKRLRTQILEKSSHPAGLGMSAASQC